MKPPRLQNITVHDGLLQVGFPMRTYLRYHAARLTRWAAHRTWQFTVRQRLPMQERFAAHRWLEQAKTRQADAAEALTHARSR